MSKDKVEQNPGKTKALENIDVNKLPDEIKYGNNYPGGGGRTPKALQLQKYEHVIKRLDGCIDDVMDELIEMIHHPDPNIRLRVCEMLLKRYVPEKKVKEIVGAGGGPVQVNQNIDIHAQVASVVQALDSMGLEEIRRQSENEAFKLVQGEIIDADEIE